MTVPVSELQSAAPSAIIELYELELNLAQHGIDETYYFHSGSNLNASGSIIWAGQAYQRWPIEASGFEYSGGQLPRPTLRVANVMGNITAVILTLPNGLEGAKVSRIRTLARYLDAANFPSGGGITYLTTLSGLQIITLDNREIGFGSSGANPLGTPDPTAEFPREIFYIDRKATENIEVVEFELCAVFDLAGVRAPKRQCISNICQWKYRGTECGYIGNAYFDASDKPVTTLAQDICGKRLSSCEIRFSQQRVSGSVAVGSNVITMTQNASLSAGDPVTGFGVPAGATVSSTSGNLVTISQSATASTSVVRAGTIQGDLLTIALASTSGIAVGMSVTGAYLPPGCQVVAVSAGSVTISSPVDPTQFFAVVGSAVGSAANQSIRFPLGTSFAIGWFISGQQMPFARRCQISGQRTITAVDSFINKNARIAKYTVADLTIDTGSMGISTATTWTFYVPTAIPAATYTFAATNQTYTFKNDSYLPYGSFPGVGTFFT